MADIYHYNSGKLSACWYRTKCMQDDVLPEDVGKSRHL
jgi:hypothetical protein